MGKSEMGVFNSAQPQIKEKLGWPFSKLLEFVPSCELELFQEKRPSYMCQLAQNTKDKLVENLFLSNQFASLRGLQTYTVLFFCSANQLSDENCYFFSYKGKPASLKIMLVQWGHQPPAGFVASTSVNLNFSWIVIEKQKSCPQASLVSSKGARQVFALHKMT